MNLKPISLSQLPVSLKVLITCFLITLGFGNIAAGVYTQKYVGLSYAALVETYSERPDSGAAKPHAGHAGHMDEVAITLDQIRQMPHKVDLKLLLQDAHVHLFSHGVLALLMGILLFWSQLSERGKVILIPLPFLGGTLDFAGMLLVKFVADAFAWLILFGGILMGLAFTVVFFLTLFEMWILPIRGK